MLHIITKEHLETRRRHSAQIEELERDVADGSGQCIAVVEDHLGDFKGAIIAWGPSGDQQTWERGATAYYVKEGFFGPVDYVLSKLVEDDIQLALK